MALPALRHPAGRNGPLLGLPPLLDELWHLPQLPRLDRERLPLRGDEIRACWEEVRVPVAVAAADPDPGAALWLENEA